MKLWQGNVYHDDRLFILDLQQAKKGQNIVWAVTTRRNIQGFPPFRVDDFPTKEDALRFIERTEPQTPRISLRGQSPQIVPSYRDYLIWLKSEGSPSSIEIYEMNKRTRGELIIEQIRPEEL